MSDRDMPTTAAADDLQAQSIGQKPSPLPRLQPHQHDVLTAEQWGILAAIADTVVPSFTRAKGNRLLQHPLRADIFAASCQRLQLLRGAGGNGADEALLLSYLAENATSQSAFKEGISRLLNQYMHEDARNGLLFILKALK